MKRLNQLLLATTVATLVLIFVGASVRASGAGLGCPDWPRCFGAWIPPTDAADLPPEFDASQFNVRRTWTEYLNRLVGASVGLLVLASTILAWAAVRRREASKVIAWDTTIALILTLFEAWLGGLVVKKGLDPRFVTVHLVFALIILGVLLHATLLARGALPVPAASDEDRAGRRRLLALAGAFLTLVSVQIVMGALVRGTIDVVAAEQPQLARGERLGEVGFSDWLHRKLALLSAVVLPYLAWRARKITIARPRVFRASLQVALASLFLQLVAGLVLAYADLPPVAQVAHIGLGTILWCSTLVVVLALRRASD